MRIKYINISPITLLSGNTTMDVNYNDIIEVSETVASHLLSTDSGGNLVDNNNWQEVEEE